MLRRVASSIAAVAVVASGLVWGAAPASAAATNASISVSQWPVTTTSAATLTWTNSSTTVNGLMVRSPWPWGATYPTGGSFPSSPATPDTGLAPSSLSVTCPTIGATFTISAGTMTGTMKCSYFNQPSNYFRGFWLQADGGTLSVSAGATVTVTIPSGVVSAPATAQTDTWLVGRWGDNGSNPNDVRYYTNMAEVATTSTAVDAGGNSIPLITINIDGNGGRCTTPSITGYQGTWTTAPTDTDCSRSGFVFTGFNTSADGSGIAIAPGGNLNLTTDNTLYAQYTQPRTSSAPTDVVAAGGYKNVKVSWTAPTDQGTSPVAAYLVQANPGGATCITNQASANILECTYTNLVPGTEYSFKVQALNQAGWSEFSAASNVVTPYDLKLDTVSRPEVKLLFIKRGSTLEAQGRTPGLAAGAVLTPVLQLGSDGVFVPLTKDTTKVDGNGNFTWSRKLGKSDNGKPASLYFTYGDGKTATLTAKLGATIGLPSAPREVKVTSGIDGITVSWQPPARDGGSPIVEYVMTSDAPAPSWARSRVIACTVKAPVTSCTMKGNVSRLDPSMDYTFSVAAKTERGTSPQATTTWKGQVYSLNIFRTLRSGSDVTLSFTATGWANPTQSFEVQAKVGAAGAWKKQGTARLDPDYVQSIGDWEGQLPKSAPAGTEVSYRLKSDRGYSNVVTFRPKSG